jgi:predicted PurR-regulated permease PerM
MTGRQVFNATVIVLVTLALAYLLLQVGQVIIVLFIAIVFASTIRPIVDWLSRHRVPRGLAILLVYLAIFAGVGGLLVVAIPPLVNLGIELLSGTMLIDRIQTLAQRLAIFGWNQFHIVLPVFELPRALSDLMGQAGDTAQKLAWPVAQNAVLVLSQVVLVIVMGVYWLTAREPMLNLLLRMSPLRHRATVEQIWTDVEMTLGSYARGQIILMGVIGIADLIGLLILRVPYAPALAVIAGLTEAIPVVGPFLGAAPAILVGFTVSGETALLVAAWYIVIQQLEGHILVPKIMERSVGLNPLVVIIALVVGGILHGVLGALLAVPVAGALQVIVRHLLIEPTIQSHELRTESGILILTDEEPLETNGTTVVKEG